MAEGRSGLVKAAQPHLQRISAPGLRLSLVKEIATLGGDISSFVPKLTLERTLERVRKKG